MDTWVACRPAFWALLIVACVLFALTGIEPI